MLVKNRYKRCAYMIKQIHADIVIFLNVITETEKNMVISGEKHLGGCGKESLTFQFVSFCTAWKRHVYIISS